MSPARQACPKESSRLKFGSSTKSSMAQPVALLEYLGGVQNDFHVSVVLRGTGQKEIVRLAWYGGRGLYGR